MSKSLLEALSEPAGIEDIDVEFPPVPGMPRPHHTMAELLAASDYSQPQPAEEREWVDASATGLEIDSWAEPSGDVDTKDE